MDALISFARKHIFFWYSKIHVTGGLIWLDHELARPRLQVVSEQDINHFKTGLSDVKNQALQIAPVKVFKNFQWICQMAFLLMIMML